VPFFTAQEKQCVNREGNIRTGNKSKDGGRKILQKWKFLICVVLQTALQ